MELERFEERGVDGRTVQFDLLKEWVANTWHLRVDGDEVGRRICVRVSCFGLKRNQSQRTAILGVCVCVYACVFLICYLLFVWLEGVKGGPHSIPRRVFRQVVLLCLNAMTFKPPGVPMAVLGIGHGGRGG